MAAFEIMFNYVTLSVIEVVELECKNIIVLYGTRLAQNPGRSFQGEDDRGQDSAVGLRGVAQGVRFLRLLGF